MFITLTTFRSGLNYGFYNSSASEFDASKVFAENDNAPEPWTLKNIKTPTGAKINIDYENDAYDKVLTGGKKPQISFSIKEYTKTGYNLELKFHQNDAYEVIQRYKDLIINGNLFFKYNILSFDMNDYPNNLSINVDIANEKLILENIFYDDELHNNQKIEPNAPEGGYETTTITPLALSEGILQLHLYKVKNGGLRVKKTEINEPGSGETYSIKYAYQNGAIGSDMNPLNAKIKTRDMYGTNIVANYDYADRFSMSPIIGYKKCTYNYYKDSQNNNESLSFSKEFVHQIKNNFMVNQMSYRSEFDVSNIETLTYWKNELIELKRKINNELYFKETPDADDGKYCEINTSGHCIGDDGTDYGFFSKGYDPDENYEWSYKYTSNNYPEMVIVADYNKDRNGHWFGYPAFTIRKIENEHYFPLYIQYLRSYNPITVVKTHITKTPYWGKLLQVSLYDSKGMLSSRTNIEYKGGFGGTETVVTYNTLFEDNVNYDEINYKTFVIAKYRVNNYETVRIVNDNNGVRTAMEKSNFDKVSGIFKKTTTKGGHNRLISNQEPAYLEDPSFGPKSWNSANTNRVNTIISSSINGKNANYTKKKFSDEAFVRKEINGVFVTENQTLPVKINIETLSGINANASRPVNTLSLLNSNYQVLESIDATGFYNTVKRTKDGLTLMEASNSAYYHSAYTSFEESEELENGTIHYMSEVCGNSNISDLHAHTGSKSVALSSGNNIFFNVKTQDNRPLLPNQVYTFSAWVYMASSQVKLDVNAGSEVVKTKTLGSVTQNGWTLVKINFKLNEAQVLEEISARVTNTGSSSIYVDDFIFAPAYSQFAGYVKDPVTGLTNYVVNIENYYTRKEYDASGAETATYILTPEGERIQSSTHRNYAGFQE